MKKLLLLLLTSASLFAQAPQAPTGLVAVIESGSGAVWARVSWVDNSDNETAFYVERAELVKVHGQWVWSAWVNQWGLFPADNTLWQDGTISTRKTYKYRVRAENAEGVSAWSNEALLE